MESKYTLHSKK